MCLLALLIPLGCGGSSDSTVSSLTDPTNQLPVHQNWNSYNLYNYQQATGWTKVITLGQVVNALPTLGDRPVLITHGLGGSIRSAQFSAMAQNLFDNQLATSVLGFEYDSQDSIAHNGFFFTQALNLLNPGVGRPSWNFIGHSMGGLVNRVAFQNGSLPIAAQGNRVVTVGTPHFGSPMANAVQNSGDVATRSALVSVLNQGGFVNPDGNPSEVSLECQGITDLRTDSIFLADLNGNIANHAQVDYYTVAGTYRGDFQRVNDLLGVTTDDGFVTILSANPPQLGALGAGLTASTHTELIQDTETFRLIRQFFVQ